jgi:pimeloyl-ACP methyl ester carboxylesterase
MTPDEQDRSAEAVEARATIARIDALSSRHDPVQDGVRVRWRRFGADTTRPPLVLLHGGHGSWMHWLRNAPALSAGRTVWVPDQPGYAESDVPLPAAPGRQPVDPLLDALVGTLDALVGADTPIDLAGFSFGGIVAAKLMQRRGRVNRLALLGSGGHGTRRRMTVEMVNWKSAATRSEERAALVHNLGALMLHSAASIDALAFEIHDIACHGTRFRSRDVSVATGLQEAIDAYTQPLLLIWGEHDVTADARPLVAQLLEGHPNREGFVVDGAGHWVQYERAEVVNARLLAFFA